MFLNIFLKIQKLLGVGSVDMLKQNKLGRQKEVIGTFAKVITFGKIKHHKLESQIIKLKKLCENENSQGLTIFNIKYIPIYIFLFIPLHLYPLPAEVGMEHRVWCMLDRCSTTELTASLKIKSIFENIICKRWDIWFCRHV